MQCYAMCHSPAASRGIDYSRLGGELAVARTFQCCGYTVVVALHGLINAVGNLQIGDSIGGINQSGDLSVNCVQLGLIIGIR